MMTGFDRRGFLIAAAGLIAGASGASAAMSPPGQKPHLRVSGRIRAMNERDAAVFDRDMLWSLGRAAFTTTTPWHTGPVAFEGVSMARLMRAVEAEGEMVTAVALNDYVVDIPLADFETFDTLLAMRVDGRDIGVREKGPFFVVYPFDRTTTLRSEKYFARSAWQVKELVVK